MLYFTEYLWEAKVWKTENGARKAAERVREKAGECMVWEFRYDEEKEKRVLLVRFSDGTTASMEA